MPPSWKLRKIVAVHKKDCTLTKTNYHPITILPVLAKVFEKPVHSRLASHFEDVYHNNVFAHRDYHGCDAAILSLTEQFKKEYEVVSLVSMDQCRVPTGGVRCDQPHAPYSIKVRLLQYQ